MRYRRSTDAVSTTDDRPMRNRRTTMDQYEVSTENKLPRRSMVTFLTDKLCIIYILEDKNKVYLVQITISTNAAIMGMHIV